MLMVTRRVGERIVIGEGVEITVREIHRRNVKLAIHVPPGQLVLRGEIWDAIAEQNRAAAAAAAQIDEAALIALATESLEGGEDEEEADEDDTP